MAKMQGVVSQFGSQGYGFIQGDDGEKYFFHKKEIVGKQRIRIKSKVIFKAFESEKGPVAEKVSVLSAKKTMSLPSLPSMTNFLLLIVVALQIVAIYLQMK